MSPVFAVTVFCSARTEIDPAYAAAATELGTAIADRGWTLVYGGNDIGLMRSVAVAARSRSGKIVGITPQLFVDQGLHDPACDELVVTANMSERKSLLERRGDAFVVLPGGLGTFEEFFEVLVGRQLGYHDKPIVLLNTLGYFGPMVEMIEHGITGRFIKPESRRIYFVAKTAAEAVAYLADAGRKSPPHRTDKVD